MLATILLGQWRHANSKQTPIFHPGYQNMSLTTLKNSKMCSFHVCIIIEGALLELRTSVNRSHRHVHCWNGGEKHTIVDANRSSKKWRGDPISSV